VLKLALIGAVLIAITVAIHAVGTAYLVRHLASTFLERTGGWGLKRVLSALMLAALILVFLHAIEIIVWAGAYKAIVPSGELADFESVVYFSFVTFTTLGYGDITLSEGYRLLSGIQALNGILLVGWSTALMFAVVQKAWQLHVAEETAGAKSEFKE
jgi:voltage-gated potassium channel